MRRTLALIKAQYSRSFFFPGNVSNTRHRLLPQLPSCPNRIPSSDPTLGQVVEARVRFCTSHQHATTTTKTWCLSKKPVQTDEFKMASDEDYMAFLDKANQDVSGQGTVHTTAGAKAQFKTLDQGEVAPKAIQEACKDTLYVSDADEPFETVSLKWEGDGGLPDEVEFAKLINHWKPEEADITIMDPTDWDPKGMYTNIVEAVREASKGNDVRVYKVVRDHSRIEYWVITREQRRIVGVKALSVES